MAFFSKKEVIIECDMSASDLIKRVDIGNFVKETKLIARQNTEVLFMRNGAVIAVIDEPGEHILNEKHKGFARLFNSNPVVDRCEVFFVNKTCRLDFVWGTPSKIDFYDARLNIPISLGTSGTAMCTVDNSMKLFACLTGVNSGISLDGITDYFRSEIALYVKDALARKLISEGVSYYEIQTDILRISKDMERDLKDSFLVNGLSLQRFTIDNLMVDENVKKAMQNVALESSINRQRGTSYTEEKRDKMTVSRMQYDVLKTAATTTPEPGRAGNTCVHCAQPIARGVKFCSFCGGQQQLVCQGCNTVLKEDSLFCYNCGKKV